MRKLVYILSPSYSGSTLLTCILAAHRQIATIGELKGTGLGDLKSYCCSCGKIIDECHFWKKLGGLSRENGENFNLRQFGTHFRCKPVLYDRVMRAGVRGFVFENLRDLFLKTVPGAGSILQSIIRRNRIVIEATCNLLGGNIFLDGSKDAVRLRYFLGSKIWDIRVIHLLRDGRGFCNSYIRHNDCSMRIAVGEWIKSQKEDSCVIKRIPAEKYLRMRYEDLCQNPSGALARICRFIGISEKEIDFRYNPQKHHILGNQMRLRPFQGLFWDQNWKKKLTEYELKIFDDNAGALNRSYGYQ